MTHAQVLEGDTLGEFCYRHGLSRDAFFAMNPEVEPLPMRDGVHTAELYPDQWVRVFVEGKPDYLFGPIKRDVLEETRACAKAGGLPIKDKGCGKLEQKGDLWQLTFADGSSKPLKPEEAKAIKTMLACINQGGMFNPLDVTLTCYPIVEFQGELYLDTRESLAGSGEGPETEAPAESGWSLSSPVTLSVGAIIVGVIILKVLL